MSELPADADSADGQRLGRDRDATDGDANPRPLRYAARAAELIDDPDEDDDPDSDDEPRPRGRRAADDSDEGTHGSAPEQPAPEAADRDRPQAGDHRPASREGSADRPDDGADPTRHSGHTSNGETHMTDEGRTSDQDSDASTNPEDSGQNPSTSPESANQQDPNDRSRDDRSGDGEQPESNDQRDDHLGQPTGKQSDQPTEKHGDQPTEKHGDQPTEKHGDQQAENKSDQPTEKPSDQPAGDHFARPQEDRPVKIEAQDQARIARTGTPQTTPTAPAPRVPTAAPAAAKAEEPADRRRSAGDLIERLTPEAPQKSTRGWRARFGLGPSQREADELRDLQTIKTTFRSPVTVMVANPKGGSGKTPVSVLLAAAFGQHRGGGVVAWDNNELRGTLPDRTASPHRRNIHDMLEALDQLRWSTSQFTDLAYFLNHQDNGNYYTLGSAQNAGHVVSGQNFRQVHELFARYFQIIVVDTGNNEAAPNWTAAAADADCLVVPTKWRKDSLIPAARMLESLQDTNPGLLERTVIAATNGPSDSQRAVKENGASWFGSSHPIVDIPIDPHIAEGGVIDYGMLRDQTRRAALRLAAEVATRLVEGGHAQD